MNRAERRRAARERRITRDSIERAINAMIKRGDADACTICGTYFLHNGVAYGGITRDGAIAYVGDCCAHQLRSIYLTGVVLDREYEHLPPTPPDAPRAPPLSMDEIAEGVIALRSYVAEMDRAAADFSKRAGVSLPVRVRTLNAPWKADDARWFEANPERSHRLRQPFPGELDREKFAEPPHGHEVNMLVRQIAPGQRMRISIYRDVECPIPDVEPVIHAMFDLYTRQGGKEFDPVSVKEVTELANKYAEAAKGSKS